MQVVEISKIILILLNLHYLEKGFVYVLMYVLMLYIPFNNFSVTSGHFLAFLNRTSSKQKIKFSLLDLILYIPSQSFSNVGTGLPGLNQYLARINVLAQGHNTVMPVRLKPAAP